MIEVRELSIEEIRAHLGALAEVLQDCVEGGASVSFMAPFSQGDAETFFGRVLMSAEAGERVVLAAFDGARLVGTVQLITATPPNQPHRADVAKLLVHRCARKQGVAAALMERVEQVSQRAGKTLLVLDTVTGGAAEKLYTRLGWNVTGVIPNYALFPDGSPCDTTIFWKQV